MQNKNDILAQFILANLPDSISERRRILDALINLRHSGIKQTRELLYHLDRHEILQRELPLHAKEPR